MNDGDLDNLEDDDAPAEDECEACGSLLWREGAETVCEWCKFYGVDADDSEDAA